MQCIACLFSLFIIALAYGAFLIIWTPTGYLFRTKSKKNWFLSSIPIFLVLLISFYLYQNRPAAIYEYRFGFLPTSDVIILRSQDSYFADTGKTYLKFTANQNTINKIVNRGLTQGGGCNNTSDLPGWWQPDPNKSLIYTGYFEESEQAKEKELFRVQDFASESECLYYDPETREAYYTFIGID